MATGPQTYTLLQDFSKGLFWTDSESVSGYLASLPDPMWVSDSFELIIDCFEEFDSSSPVYMDFGNAATAKLYVTYADQTDTPTEITTISATVTQNAQTEYHRVTINVAKDIIATAYAGEDQCFLYVQVAFSDGNDRQRTFGQRLFFTDNDGDGSANATADVMGYTPGDSNDWTPTVPDDVAEALDILADGIQIPRVSASIDFTSTGDTVVFTVPSGRVFIPDRLLNYADILTGYAAAHTYKLKTGGGDVFSAHASGHAAVLDVDVDDLPGTQAYAAGTVFTFEVTVAGTSTTHDGHAILTGVLLDA